MLSIHERVRRARRGGSGQRVFPPSRIWTGGLACLTRPVTAHPVCAVSSAGLAVVFGLSFVKFLQLLLWVVFVDYIATGMIVGTILWFLANRYLKGPSMASFVDQSVEWGYAFDVHCNAFFPLLLILHVLQLFLIKG